MNLKKIFLLILLLGICFLSYAGEEFVYNNKSRRDPFLPLVSKDGYLVNREADIPASDMNLEGIIYDKTGNSLAIINGNVLKTGNKIADYTIIRIEKKGVVLQSNTEEFFLELKQEVE